MPLKHGTETRMVFILGLMTALTGLACSFLPPVSVTFWPWLLVFSISLIYPMVLYPMMKERRADYEFRALHFVPALMLLLWLAIDLIVAFRPDWHILQSVYTWGWAGVMVVIAFILMVLFCLKVIRQRWPRLMLLAGVLLPFFILSQLSEIMDWDRKLAMAVWDGDVQTGSGLIAGGGTSSNLNPSSNMAEEQWREQLRQMERRRQQIAQADSSSSLPGDNVSSDVVIASNDPVSSSPFKEGSSSSEPPHLPSSGFGMEGVALMTLAGCCASIHRKSVKRAKA